MKNKLFCTVILLFLASFGFNANADVLIDTSNCNKVLMGVFPNYGTGYALFCPNEGPYYIAVFVQWDAYRPCVLGPGSPAYRTEGDCENYLVYRIE